MVEAESSSSAPHLLANQATLNLQERGRNHGDTQVILASADTLRYLQEKPCSPVYAAPDKPNAVPFSALSCPAFNLYKMQACCSAQYLILISSLCSFYIIHLPDGGHGNDDTEHWTCESLWSPGCLRDSQVTWLETQDPACLQLLLCLEVLVFLLFCTVWCTMNLSPTARTKTHMEKWAMLQPVSIPFKNKIPNPVFCKRLQTVLGSCEHITVSKSTIYPRLFSLWFFSVACMHAFGVYRQQFSTCWHS